MANDTPLTIIGNLTADPELRFTQSGIAVASFTIASTPRVFDRQANEWRDGDALFMRCSAWRDLAENVTESLEKGSRVIAQGNLQQRSYTDKEGQQRTVMELDVQEVGPSLRYATAAVSKVDRRNAGRPQGGPAQGGGGYGAPQAGYGGQGGGQAPQGGTQGYDDPPWSGDPAPF